jgi:hypothetical protein
MLSQEFQRYVPAQWQDGGLVTTAPRKPSQASFLLRKAEKWKNGILVGAVALSCIVGGTTSQQILFIPPVVAGLSRTVVGTGASEPVFMRTTAHFDVSPEYWANLAHRIKQWRPLPPDSEGPDIEPAI